MFNSVVAIVLKPVAIMFKSVVCVQVDKVGNLFAGGPGGVHVYAEDGSHLGAILTGRKTANIALGGTPPFVYIAADSEVKRVAQKGSK